MSSGFHRVGANAGRVPGWSNSRSTGLARKPLFDPDGFMAGSAAPDHLAHLIGTEDAAIARALATGKATDATLLDSERIEPPAMGRAQAVQSGYTGDQCSHCSSMRMKISGHCMVCEDCGTTTGCS